MLIRVLVMASSVATTRRLERLVSQPHVAVTAMCVRRGAWPKVGDTSTDMVVAEREALPAPELDAIRAIGQLPERPDVVVLSRQEDPLARATLLSGGCTAVLTWEVPDEVLRKTLETLVQRRREAGLLRLQDRAVDREVRLHNFASASPSMHKLLQTAQRVAMVDTSLLLMGETGVGKERLARGIHADSRRRAGPFVAVNCAAIPESLIESELFGHEKGAFTGAVRARRGHFEVAHRGTLFLDEVADLPLSAQAKLLRALQERTIQPLGSERPQEIDVRIIAATNRDLPRYTEEGRFRSDLFYRLSVVTMLLPPLRERREDIPLLAEHYRNQFATRLGRPVKAIAPEAMAQLIDYPWPGNVRELINLMERVVLLCNDETIGPADLAELSARRPPAGALSAPAPADGWAARSWRDERSLALARVEQAYLSQLLRHTRGHLGEAARLAGLSRRGLFEKLRRHHLDKASFRPPAPQP